MITVSQKLKKYYKLNLKPKIDQRLKSKDIQNGEHRFILEHFGLNRIINLENKKIQKEIILALHIMLYRKLLLEEVVANKGVRNPIDVHYVWSQIITLQKYIDQFVTWCRDQLDKHGSAIPPQDVSERIQELNKQVLKVDNEITIWQFKRCYT